MNIKEFIEYLGDNNSFIEKIYLLDIGNNRTELKERVEDGDINLEGLNVETEDMDFDEFFDLCLNNEINFVAEFKMKVRFNGKLNDDNEITSYSTGGSSYIDWLYGTELKDIYLMAEQKIEELKANFLKKVIKERDDLLQSK